jgi:hypothetical protein
MRLTLRIAVTILLFFLLTIITQVGGIFYLLALITFPFINRRINNRLLRFGLKALVFITLYSFGSFLITPILATRYNRVPLPMFERNHIKPRNIFTCILNRHYVRPEVLKVVNNVAFEMDQKYPGTVINYLDAGFPLFNSYPLTPHLSHNDGKKLDIALFYIDKQSGKPSDLTPSPIGYGVYEGPQADEVNQPFICQQKGNWQYGFLQKLVPQDKKDYFVFDEARTRSVCNYITSDREVEKIFIEPHLRSRLKLSSTKVRYHGCGAVRHDDHIHLQIR